MRISDWSSDVCSSDLRASAHRFLDNRNAALADVEAALTMDPANPEGLLERGNLRRLDGDTSGAREDWLAVTRLAPQTPAAAAAQANLAKLDVTVEEGATLPTYPGAATALKIELCVALRGEPGGTRGGAAR